MQTNGFSGLNSGISGPTNSVAITMYNSQLPSVIFSCLVLVCTFHNLQIILAVIHRVERMAPSIKVTSCSCASSYSKFILHA